MRLDDKDNSINFDEVIAYSNYCVMCYPEKVRACYIYGGDSLCEKCMREEWEEYEG